MNRAGFLENWLDVGSVRQRDFFFEEKAFELVSGNSVGLDIWPMRSKECNLSLPQPRRAFSELSFDFANPPRNKYWF
jgi:hypothetical protein